MKIINGYRVEKDTTLKSWIAFKKIGISGWLEVNRNKKFKEVKEWCEKHPLTKERKKKNGSK